MSLSPGLRIGSYELGEPIGSGGMGDVYRARDVELKRDVAIKVLPESFAADAERVSRFRLEAEVLASLNHANIAQIYGLESIGEQIAIVMEFVDGPTLSDRIAAGRVPAEEALGIASQIAAALEAAHGNHIVHRDLKPANIKLRSDGVVKVLDFGIAKALVPAPDASGTPAPLMTTPVTQGVILGTAAYMSPEQARGLPVDQRTDIWAFGCVLYEMITGQPAFAGADVSVTLARVLEREADTNSLPDGIAPAVRTTLELCLQKDLRNRVADIRDVRLALGGRFESGIGTDSLSESRSRHWLPFAALALVVGVAIGAGAVWLAAPSESAPEVEHFALELPTGEPLGLDNQSMSLAISPDGREIVFSTEIELNTYRWFRQSLAELEAIPLRGAGQNFETPFFSHDGRWIGFNDIETGELKKIPVLGGPAVAIGPVPNIARGASWGEDDTILFGVEDSGLWRVPGGGGNPEQLTFPAEGAVHRWPQWLPGGDAALFTIAVGEFQQIALLDIESRAIEVLIPDGTTPFYASSGHIVYGVADGTLRAVAFDVASLTVTSDPVPVLEGIAMATVSGGAHYQLTRDGSLLYGSGAATGLEPVELTWWPASGNSAEIEPLGMQACDCRAPAVSPNGDRVAMSVGLDNTDIYVYTRASANATRLTFESGSENSPVWSPDGSRIAYRSAAGIAVRRSDGAGSAELILSDAQAYPTSWTVDDRLVITRRTGGSLRLATIDPIPGAQWQDLVIADDPTTLATQGVVSPDGRWLAYARSDAGAARVFVSPFPPVDATAWQVSQSTALAPRWSSDGSRLFYVSLSGDLMAASIATEPFASGTPEVIIPGTFSGALLAQEFPYSIEPGTDRVLYARSPETDDAVIRDSGSRLILIQHWLSELERLVSPD
jgi:serine/threonine protein kinase/Tol biopolymer transport system component